jgi:hypothetical protein
MAKGSALDLGRIVWAEIADANGVRKSRPAVVVTTTERILPGQPLLHPVEGIEAHNRPERFRTRRQVVGWF